LELSTRTAEKLRADSSRALEATQRYLLSIQKEDGHWCGELEGDTILQSEYILCNVFLGREHEDRVRKAGEDIRRKQLPEGGWAIFPGGEPEVSASVKAYFVLKLLGDKPDEPHMVRARETILRLGGVEACNSFTKIYLAIFGQYDWRKTPAVPPEIILLPRWFYINIYEMSSWSRAIVIPLSIIWAHKPYCSVVPRANIKELYDPNYRKRPAGLWATFFHALDRGLKLLERLPIKPSRELALKRAEKWILDRLDGSDGLGAIFPPIVNTILALRCLDYPVEHPTVQAQIAELEKLEIEEEETLRVQPCFSPVWDTALAMNALVESGMRPGDPTLLRAAHWLLDKRGNGDGDWRVKNRNATRPGWFFEYANPYYPDNDTTAMVLTALSKVRFPDEPTESTRRLGMREALAWHLSMQNDDGGWSAFDKGCDKQLLCHVPFADHNAMIDPSNEDITARILESLSCLGYDRTYGPARRAVIYLLRQQEPDGSWYGRWGCNYLYGTWLALWGLRLIGEPLDQPAVRRAASWLAACQNDDGGWGETPRSYSDVTAKGRGPSTPSQTAWALMGLMAAGEVDSDAVRRGIDYLVREQHDDGSWHEEYWTGTGFPGVFYLRYHLYGIYFPLLALAHYRKLLEGGESLDWAATA
jgi:squalene-hopene/tetraprenyl-beta-curcumene cyclase